MHLTYWSVAQVVSGFSRMGAAVLATVPPERTGHFSDRAMLGRAVQRPPNAFEAFQRAGAELLTGFTAATGGILLDPIRVRGAEGLRHHPAVTSMHRPCLQLMWHDIVNEELYVQQTIL